VDAKILIFQLLDTSHDSMMKKALLVFGIILLITGITLASLSSVIVSHWENFTVDSPESELVLNKAFETRASSISTYTLNLNKDDNLTITGAISKPQSNRSIGAAIDFSINDSARIYLSYDRATNVTLRWTVPQDGNYSFTFDNTFDSAAKDIIVMVMKNWHEPQQYTMLVHTPLVSNPYWFLWVGVVLLAVGIILAVLCISQKSRVVLN
jgi:hypothetical protein